MKKMLERIRIMIEALFPGHYGRVYCDSCHRILYTDWTDGPIIFCDHCKTKTNRMKKYG